MFLISFSINLLRGENERPQLVGNGGPYWKVGDSHTKVLCHDFSQHKIATPTSCQKATQNTPEVGANCLAPLQKFLD